MDTARLGPDLGVKYPSEERGLFGGALRSIDELEAARDEILLGLIELRTKGAKTSAASKASARVA